MWDSYNYEEESPAATYTPAVMNQGEEPDEDYNTREGLLCEEDAEVSFFSDNLQQWHEDEAINQGRNSKAMLRVWHTRWSFQTAAAAQHVSYQIVEHRH